jgi:hypothetical protein
MNEQLALSTVYNQFPNVARNIRGTSQYIAKESQDVFYDVECNRRVKLGEILKFTATHPNRYTWIQRIDERSLIFYESFNFTYAGTFPIWEGDTFVGYDYLYNLLYRQTNNDFPDRNLSGIITVPILLPDVSLIYDQNLNISEPFADLHSWVSLVDLIDQNSYETNSPHHITLDVKSLYKIILNRERCINHFGKIFAKLYVLREFINFIDRMRQYKYGDISINFYIADNANMLDIEFDRMLLMTDVPQTEDIESMDEFWQQHIINTGLERERVIQAIKDAIQKF